MRRRWTLRLVAGLAAGAVVLSGCSKEQAASDTLPEAEASPTASEPALPPLGPPEFPVPTEAREKTPKGALAFAEYYMSLGARIGTGQVPPGTLRDLSENCALCQQVAASYEADRAAGYTYRGATHSFTEYGLPRVADSTAEVGFVYTQSAYTVVDSTGKEIPERAGQASGELQSGMLLEWRPELHTWLVTDLTVG